MLNMNTPSIRPGKLREADLDQPQAGHAATDIGAETAPRIPRRREGLLDRLSARTVIGLTLLFWFALIGAGLLWLQ